MSILFHRRAQILNGKNSNCSPHSSEIIGKEYERVCKKLEKVNESEEEIEKNFRKKWQFFHREHPSCLTSVALRDKLYPIATWKAQCCIVHECILNLQTSTPEWYFNFDSELNRHKVTLFFSL